jgi:hypothetical protein
MVISVRRFISFSSVGFPSPLQNTFIASPSSLDIELAAVRPAELPASPDLAADLISSATLKSFRSSLFYLHDFFMISKERL